MTWVTIRTFDNMPDAYIVKGRLTVENIPSVLKDEHLVQTDWLYSIAVGGIKLQVAPEHVAQALEILAENQNHDDFPL